MVLLYCTAAVATDWPQYRGPNSDGTSPDPISTHWPVNGPTLVWTNGSLTNGFSCIAVSQGRAFVMISRLNGSGTLREYCVAVDAGTGTNIWATAIDDAPWSPAANYNGGDGTAPYNMGDGPRTTASVAGGRVFTLSGLLSLVCLNFTNGSVIWSNNLHSAYGASYITYENASSLCLDNDLVFVNLNTSSNNKNLAAFRTSDGGLAWSSQNENITHTTPVVTTIQGVRQVIFATQTGLVSLNRTNGTFLWKFSYPWGPIYSYMGASPLVYSNTVFCTAGYFKGAAAAQITLNNSVWQVTQLYYKNGNAGQSYRSIWMTPVCSQGYIYTLCGENSTFLTTPLSCIELATGNLMWTTNGFGMGGLILVQTNLLVLTEDGQLVLVQTNPNAYTELARHQTFQFSYSIPGKCWNNPTYSNGRIYAHSTTAGVAFDVSLPSALPNLITVGASNATASAATLYGSVNPNGATTSGWFQWGLTASYGSNTPATSNLTGTSAISISNVLSGLTPATTYHFRVAGTNSAGATNGADLTFTTLPPAPTLPNLITVGASNVTAAAATLYGGVNPDGATTGAWFQWGLTASYGSNTPATSNLTGTNALGVSNVLGGLTPATTYHFRVAGTNSAGATNGADLTFATTPPAPVITNQPHSRAAVVGGAASFTVGASSPPANTYQWFFFATILLAGQTNATSSFTNLQNTNFGGYSVIVGNGFGSVTSIPASLTLAASPLVSYNTIYLAAFALTFSTEFGPTYFVDYKTQLDASAWLPFTNVPGTGLPITITDNTITNAARFFRIHLQ